MPLFGYLQGWTAVWLFFAISGYLVTMLMIREEKSHGRVAFGPFLIKRFFRIVPSYWMAILIYWLACLTLLPLADDYESFMVRLPYFLSFMPEYANANGYSIFTHSWTVGVELKFYLLFPPVVFLMIRNANWRFAVNGDRGRAVDRDRHVQRAILLRDPVRRACWRWRWNGRAVTRSSRR